MPRKYMNVKQLQTHEELKIAYQVDENFDPGARVQLEILACALEELRDLQAYVNKHGTTYEVVGKSGDIYSKHRPEHQQLTEARQRVAQLARSLESKVPDKALTIDELLA
jgi:hypothetical protein